KPLVEAVGRKNQWIGDGFRRRPGGPVVIREGSKNVGHAGGREIHPGTIETAIMRAAAAIGIAGRVLQRAAKGNCRNCNIECQCFVCDYHWSSPGIAAVE